MTSMYDNPHKNLIALIFQYIVVALSITVNSTLIWLILSCKRKEFGLYRYLLLTFASVDIYYAIVHFLVMPIPESYGNAFYMGAHGFVRGKAAVCWFASAHSHSFPVLVFHFLYRYLAVKGSRFIFLFDRWWFYFVQFLFVAAIGVCWFCVLYFLYNADDSFVIEYMRPILEERAIGIALPLDQYSVAVFWTNGTFSGPRWTPIIGVALMATTMTVCYSFMIFAAFRIVWYMSHSQRAQSDKTARLQKQLFTTLMYQMLLPLITAYAPPLISVVNPFFGVSLSYIANISPILCGTHPWLDGCVIIYTIREYRVKLLNTIGRRILGRPLVASSTFKISTASEGLSKTHRSIGKI